MYCCCALLLFLLVVVAVVGVFCLQASSIGTMSTTKGEELLRGLSELHPDIYTLEALSLVDDDSRASLLSEFEFAKQKLCYRFKLAYGFWSLLPWSLLRLGAVLLKPECASTLEQSRLDARQYLDAYARAAEAGAASVARLGCVAKRFLDRGGELYVHVQRFANGEPMALKLRRGLHWFGDACFHVFVCVCVLCESVSVTHNPARRELISYGMGLTSMSRLESRHHLVANQMSSGRASLPPLISAELRRHANNDVNTPEFRSRLGFYLSNLSSVLGDASDGRQWNNRREFLMIVYGYGVDELHMDVSSQAAAISNYRDNASALQDADAGRVSVITSDFLAMGPEWQLCVEQARACLAPGNFYAAAVPTTPGMAHVFQVLASSPGNKRYVEKICFIGEDVTALVLFVFALFL